MPPTIKDVDERYALAVDNINQSLERAERFQLDTTARLAAVDNSLAWITKIGAFMGSALLAVIFLSSH